MGTAEQLVASDLRTALRAYAEVLGTHREAINRLNVYPVPDGDTGTNMALTLSSVVAALGEAGEDGMAATCRAISHGALMGARGNSGLILSQVLRGLADAFSCADAVGPGEVAGGLVAAAVAARQAVSRPVEGTILTVARAAGEGAEAAAGAGGGLVAVLEGARSEAAAALERTPDQLPALAQAGVVDAGGAGYVLLFDALLSAVAGNPLPAPPGQPEQPRARGAGAEPERAGRPGPPGPATDGPSVADLRYEVMYILEAPEEAVGGFREVWAGLGDSIVVVGGGSLWNCHIHTDDIGAAIEAALDVGRPRDIRVTDLLEQVEEERWVREAAARPEVQAPEPPGRPLTTGVVAVANGDGIRRIFGSLGVSQVVAGGQSMNPSTAELLAAVEAVPADQVVVLPDNPNIVPVAEAAARLSPKQVKVLATRTTVEGFAALMEYDPQAGAQENWEAMGAAAARVVTGEVTRAVRASTGPAGPIAEGDWLGLSVGSIEVVESAGVAEAACALLAKLCRDDHELVTLIEGEGAHAADTRRVTEWLAEHRPGVTAEVHHGGQPLYPYLISIE